MDVLNDIKELIAEILDIEEKDIDPETYLIRDFDAESIDLLELAVSLNSAFKKKINDNDIFLTNLRDHLAKSKNNGNQAVSRVHTAYPFLSRERVGEILEDLEEGPVLKVKDLVSYIDHAD